MQQWKIRILSGVHSGVEVTLPNDSLVIGSDDFIADLVLTDSGVNASHLILVCDNDNIVLKDCEDVSVNQEHVELNSEGIELTRNSLVSVGQLTFAIGHLEDDLVFETTTNVEDKTSRSVTQKKSSGWRKSLFSGLLFSLLPSAIFASIWYQQIYAADDEVTNQAEPIVVVRDILDELKLEDIRVEWNAAARQAMLEGYVEDNTTKLQFLRRIDSLGINYKSDLRTMAEIRRAVRFILRNLGYHQIKVENGEETGTLLLTGYIDDAGSWNQVEQILERDVPGLVAWKVDLQRADAYMETLKELLKKAELLEKVQLVTSDDRVEVRGELDDIETTRFYSITREFREQVGEKPYLVLKSIPKVSKGTNNDFPFRSVNFGRVPYVILTDNVRYMVGSRTPQGYRISSVTPESIELIKGGQVIAIELGDRGKNTNDKS